MTSRLDKLAAHSTATLVEVIGYERALNSRIKPIDPSMQLCGRVVTAYSPPGDNLLVHAAIQQATSSDIVAVATQGFEEAGIFGELLALSCLAKGVGGFITDGSVRDTAALRRIGLPIFTAGICIRGTTKLGGGHVGKDIYLGGVMVRSGDILVGDADGVVVLHDAELDSVLSGAEERDRAEQEIGEELRAGRSSIELYDLAPILERNAN